MRLLLTIILLHIFFYSYSQVPYGLNSNPSARPTAFLDFDGQTVDDIYWRPFNGDSIVYCSPSLLNNASMIKVFNHVAEDFRPFNINITTDSSVYFAAPITTRVRVIITPTFRWYGTSGGVAYVESFRWGLNTPCFVFDTLLSQNDKRVAEAVSHEIGHTLGLYHQSRYLHEGTDTCRFSVEYHPGRGSGDIAWAPIMGNSYDRNMGLWHIGRTLSCTTIQNDLSIISSTANGITYRADDHGDTINSSTPITLSEGNYFVEGIINDSTDNDYFEFKFNTPGRFTANIKPFNSGPPNIRSGLLIGVVNYNGNVDLEATLFRNNIAIRTYNPNTRLDASIDTILEPDTYYLKINSISNINIFKSAMLGSYTLGGSYTGSIIVPIYSLTLRTINDKLEWEIITDESVNKKWIESSSNGYDFKLYKYVNGLNGSIETSNNKDPFYRLVATTESGAIYYSKIIYTKRTAKYRIISNLIKNDIVINTDKSYDWVLYDMNGKKIYSGRMTIGLNKIPINISSGTYILQLINEDQLMIEKIIKL